MQTSFLVDKSKFDVCQRVNSHLYVEIHTTNNIFRRKIHENFHTDL